MSRYLVTGATGFLGRHLVQKLIGAGHKVVALCREESAEPGAPGGGPVQALHPVAKPGVSEQALERRTGDVLDRASVRAAAEGCDGVFHLAGKVSRDPEDAELLFSLHVTGTENVLLAAHEAGVKRVVYASTSGVVAVSEDPDHIATEDDPTPLGIIQRWPYYRSKLFAEQKALEIEERIKDLEVVCLNPTLLLGPGDVHRSSTGDVERILEGKVPVIPSGGLSYVDVRDVADAFLLAMERGRSGRRYLLGACNLTLRAFVRRVSRMAGLTPPLLTVPRIPALGKALVSLAEWGQRHLGEDDLIDPVSLDMARHYWYLDATRAETELGWRARDPLETLSDTIEDLYPWEPRQRFSVPKREKVSRVIDDFARRLRQR